MSTAGANCQDRNNVLLDRYESAMLGVFARPSLVLTHGDGRHVFDVDGNRYLDLVGGIAVNALGHDHPRLVQALQEQVSQVIHICNSYASEQQIYLAERLLALSEAPKGSKVFFANSGTEANECAVKLCRKTGRRVMVALEGAFHGRSTGSLALTYKPSMRKPFEPLIQDVLFVPPNDISALQNIFTQRGDEIAGLFIEPILGEAGVFPLDEHYLLLARRLTKQHNALLIFDEVQTGVGRTGKWFAWQHTGVMPDVMSLAKGLGGGVPIGAVVTFGERSSELLRRSEHGSTFGGNPLACAAALAVLHVIEEEKLIDNANIMGRYIIERLRSLNDERIVEVRGKGLMIGIGLAGDIAEKVMQIALSDGFIINAVQPDIIRLAPALNINTNEIDSFLVSLPSWFSDVL